VNSRLELADEGVEDALILACDWWADERKHVLEIELEHGLARLRPVRHTFSARRLDLPALFVAVEDGGPLEPEHPAEALEREGVALEYHELLGLASWLPERIKRIIPLCGTVGLRFTEAATLTDDRGDLEAGTVFIPARINKSRRPKPIPLARIEVQLLREQLMARPAGTRVVFASEKGGIYTHSGFQSVFLPALLAAGLAHEEARNGGRTIVVADFKFHWLRHTAISLMARAGMKAELIAERVGHNDGGGLIYRRYRHLFPSEVREAVAMLDRMVAETTVNAEAGGSTSGQ
jgi:integrase